MSRLRIALIVVGTVLVGGCAWLAVATTGYPAALKRPAIAPTAVRIDNVRIISMAPGSPAIETDKSVLVVDGVIRQVAPPAAINTPEGAEVVDGGGQTLLPGLIDAHVHVWDEAELAGYLAHGVTSVRNMSGMPFHASLIRRIEQRKILGPDFVTTGPILNSPGANVQDNHQIVATAEEARTAVQEQYAAGYRTLKVYSNLYREPYEAILDEAARLDMTIVGHTPEGVRAEGAPYEKPFDIAFEEILDDGFGTIEHVELIVWHGLRDRLDEDGMRDLAGRIADAGVIVTPTLIAQANLVRVAETRGAYLDRPGTETLNPLIQRLEAANHEHWSRQDPQAREAPRAAFYLKATKMLHDAGVPLIAGTDAGIFTNIPGSSMTRELELLVKAGLSPYDALAMATVNAGPAIGLADRGQVSPGFQGNLLLVSGDPLTDVSRVENPSAVMMRGVWLDADALEEMRQAARQTSVPRTGRRVAATLLALR